MIFDPPLIPARLIRRYKRFLADVRLADGSEATVYCPNTGAMLGCDAPDSKVWLSTASNPKRKYALTWELVQPRGGPVVGINTGLTNHLVAEALDAGQIPELACANYRREVAVAGGRLDFVLDPDSDRPVHLEVKNVTAAVDDGQALFPDARSARAVRHLQHLRRAADGNVDAALLFCVQRCDVASVRPADQIDPAFAAELVRAAESGVQILAYRWTVTPREIHLDAPVRVQI